MIKETEYILCAAIHFDDGKHHDHQPKNIKTGFVICGRRHHNCFASVMSLIGIDGCISLKEDDQIQGFLTSKDIFLNREEAYILAKSCGQIGGDDGEKELYSEDIY